jgi:Fic/DOC family
MCMIAEITPMSSTSTFTEVSRSPVSTITHQMKQKTNEIHRLQTKPISDTPEYWKQFAHPHPSLAIPACFFDLDSSNTDSKSSSTSKEFQDSTRKKNSDWQLGICYAISLPWGDPSSLPITMWKKLHEIMIEPTVAKTISVFSSSVTLSAGHGYRTGLGMRYLISSPSVLFSYSTNQVARLELKSFWNDGDFQNWENIVRRIRAFQSTVQKRSSSPFDDFLKYSGSTFSVEEWKTLRKIAFIPPTTPDHIEKDLNEFHSSLQKDLISLRKLFRYDPPNRNEVKQDQSKKSIILPSQETEHASNVLFEKLAHWHDEFINITPFRFGNGRILRVVLNIILMHFGFLPLPCAPYSGYIKAIRSNKLYEFFTRQNSDLRRSMVNANGDDLLDIQEVPDPTLLSVKTSILEGEECCPPADSISFSHTKSTDSENKKPSSPFSSNHEKSTESQKEDPLRQKNTDVPYSITGRPTVLNSRKNKITESTQQSNAKIGLIDLLQNEMSPKALETIIKNNHVHYSQEQWLFIAETALSLNRHDLIGVLCEHKCISLTLKMSDALRSTIRKLL